MCVCVCVRLSLSVQYVHSIFDAIQAYTLCVLMFVCLLLGGGGGAMSLKLNEIYSIFFFLGIFLVVTPIPLSLGLGLLPVRF